MVEIFSPAVSGRRKYMKIKAQALKKPSNKKVQILPPFYSNDKRNTDESVKSLIWLVAVARDAALSIKWIGYISELTTHGVDPKPIAKANK